MSTPDRVPDRDAAERRPRRSLSFLRRRRVGGGALADVRPIRPSVAATRRLSPRQSEALGRSLAGSHEAREDESLDLWVSDLRAALERNNDHVPPPDAA